ncbi:MAG: hypothetical protein RL591_54 [Planctomycetota bacterium]
MHHKFDRWLRHARHTMRSTFSIGAALSVTSSVFAQAEENRFSSWIATTFFGGDVPNDVDAIRIIFARPLPSWGWFLVVVAALLVGVWSYRRIATGVTKSSRLMRGCLSLVRAATLVLIAVLIAGPAVRFERTRVERDRLVVLVDRSLSMSIKDGPNGESRDEQVREALEAMRPALQSVAKTKDIDFVGFAGGAFSFVPNQATDDPSRRSSSDGATEASNILPELGAATGERTDLDGALRQALARASGRPLSAVVLLSDGRSAVPISANVLRGFERDSIPVHTVALGSSKRLGDAAIVAAAVPARAFIRDRVPVEVRIDRGGVDRDLSVRIVDSTSGVEITRKVVPASDDGEEVSVVLDAASESAGSRSWRAEIVSDEQDLVRENDAREFAVEFVDRPLRVLYVEGSSRWEYRYFKNLLMREKDLESSIMLLSADRDFAQEGNLPIARLPRTREEFSKYDLFIIGDVPSGFFSPDQLTIIRSEVADRGAGLLWIGGERNTPMSWESTPLADLFPFKPPFSLEPRAGVSLIEPTPAAARLGVLRLTDEEDGWPDVLTDKSLRWPQLRYVQDIPRARWKPTAEVLAIAEGVGAGAREATPAVMRMRFGAGDVMYVATDEIWRWRYGQGERYPERFWVPLVRLLSREAIAQGDARAELVVAPTRIVPGASTVVSLRIVDDESAARAPSVVPVEIRDLTGAAVARVELTRDGADASAIFSPERTGRFIAVADDPAFGHLEAAFEVVRADDELRRGDTDHAALSDLSQRTGGQVLSLESLRGLAELLPLRARETDESVERTIWDTWIALTTLLVLLAIEWCGRRLLRLV